MKSIIKLVVVISFSIYSNSSLAITCSQTNNELSGIVGLDSSSGTIYATTISSTNQCSCPNVRFTTANTDTKAALSILLSAKMANKKVRVDFLDANNCNSAYRVYVQ